MPFPKVVPAAARQTMRSAFEDLEKIVTAQDFTGYPGYSLERVRQEALDMENQLGSRGWLCNMRRLKPLFTGLEHYSKVVDTLCNGTPYLPWIWAPITLVLRIASEHIESFDCLIGAYGRIGSALQRFEVLHKSFLGDSRFHETTAAFYADILEFHKHAYKFVRRSGWKLLFSTSWGRFQRRFENILDNMKRHEDLIDRLVNAIDISEARQIRQELSSWREQSLQKITLEDKEQSAKEFYAIQSWLRMDERDQLTIFDSIASQGTRYPGTCAWIMSNAKFKSWLQSSPQTPILWLSGIAGSGKSVISSQIVNFMRSRNEIVLRHFCTNTSFMSSEYDQVLKTLIEQVLRQDGDLTACVYNDYVLKKQIPGIPILEQLLQTLLTTSAKDPSQRNYIWIVLDGVDELRDHSPNSQARLLNFVKQIVSKTAASEAVTCKAIISGRPSTTVSHVLRYKPTVSLSEEKASLGSAIQEYALQRLGSLRTRFQQLGLTALEIEDIGQQIAQKSDGMFLYARLVLDFISSNVFVRGDELRNSINQLPRELSSFYLQLLSQILAPLDHNSKRHIECIFGWVAFSRRPLRRSELLSAVGFSSGDPDTEFPAPQYILDICRSLIEERSDTTLMFIHVSVKEFLQSSSSNLVISEETAVGQHCIASIACLLSSMRLLSQQRQQAFRVLVRGVYGIQLYATEYWTEYLLSFIGQNGGLDGYSTLFNLLYQLSAGIDAAFQNDREEDYREALSQDKRFDHLKEHQSIYHNVRKATCARSLQQLEHCLRSEISMPEAVKERSAPVRADGVSALLAQYQNLLLHIMNEPDIPGVSFRELEAFRNEFATSVHTCRLRTCPRATVGFETQDLRIEHEVSHVRRYPCTRMGCQYPPFLSPGSLKAHVQKEHVTVTSPRPIRRVNTAVTNVGTVEEHRQVPREAPAVPPPPDLPLTASMDLDSRPAPAATTSSNNIPNQQYIPEKVPKRQVSSSLSALLNRDSPPPLPAPPAPVRKLGSTFTLANPARSKGPSGAEATLPDSIDLSLSNRRSPQPDFLTPQGPQRGPDQEELTNVDKQKIQALAQNLMLQTSEAQKQKIMQDAISRLSPQRLAQMRAAGHDPLAMWFQREATKRFFLARQDLMQLNTDPSPQMDDDIGQRRLTPLQEHQRQLTVLHENLQRQRMAQKDTPSMRSPDDPLRTGWGFDLTSKLYPGAARVEHVSTPVKRKMDDGDVQPDELDRQFGPLLFQSNGVHRQQTPTRLGRPSTLPMLAQRKQRHAAPPFWAPVYNEEPLRNNNFILRKSNLNHGRTNGNAETSHNPKLYSAPFPADTAGGKQQAAPRISPAGPYRNQTSNTNSNDADLLDNLAPPSLRPEPVPPPQSKPEVATLAFSEHVGATPHNAAEPPKRFGRATPTNANGVSAYWSVAEMNDFPQLLRSFGTDWQAIAQHLPTKSAGMVKNFYNKQTSREKPEWGQIATEADNYRNSRLSKSPYKDLMTLPLDLESPADITSEGIWKDSPSWLRGLGIKRSSPESSSPCYSI